MHRIRVYIDNSVISGTQDEGFNSVNVRNGYRSMTILSPLEVGDEDEEEGL